MTPFESLLVSNPKPSPKDLSNAQGARSPQDNARSRGDQDFSAALGRLDAKQGAAADRTDTTAAAQIESQEAEDVDDADATDPASGTVDMAASLLTKPRPEGPHQAEADAFIPHWTGKGQGVGADGTPVPGSDKAQDMSESQEADATMAEDGKRTSVSPAETKSAAGPRPGGAATSDRLPLSDRSTQSPGRSSAPADQALTGGGIDQGGDSSLTRTPPVLPGQAVGAEADRRLAAFATSSGRALKSAKAGEAEAAAAPRSGPGADVRGDAILTAKPVAATDAERRMRSIMQKDLADLDSESSGPIEREAHSHQLRPTQTSFAAAMRESTPALARQVASQMAAAVQHRPDGVTEIALNPQELGRVQMTLRAHEQAVTVMIVAERNETGEMMRRHVDQLAQEFRAMGFTSVNFEFGGQSARHGQDREQPTPTPGTELPMVEQSNTARPVALSSQHNGSLDLRV